MGGMICNVQAANQGESPSTISPYSEAGLVPTLHFTLCPTSRVSSVATLFLITYLYILAQTTLSEKNDRPTPPIQSYLRAASLPTLEPGGEDSALANSASNSMQHNVTLAVGLSHDAIVFPTIR